MRVVNGITDRLKDVSAMPFCCLSIDADLRGTYSTKHDHSTQEIQLDQILILLWFHFNGYLNR